MRLNLNDYYSPEEWALFMAEAEKYESPFLLINLDIVERNFHTLQDHFPFAEIYFAVKANPAIPVLELLRDLGSHFDVASIYELDLVLSLGVDPARVSFGNTIKKIKHVEYAYQRGVRLFASDSESDIRNLAKAAPGSRIFVRILTEGGETADWPLSRKFGCHPDMAIDLIMLAKKLELIPWGISFHVGSQQRDIGTWDSAISKVRYIFSYLEEEKIELKLINMGGGFPASYISRTQTMDIYAEEINRYLHEDFGDNFPSIILEPGRSLVAEAGIMVTEVVLVSKKSTAGVDRWVYLDTGKFNGLIETWSECIKYPLYCESAGRMIPDFIIAGPTCDSQDVMYEQFRNPLPRHIDVGDRVYWLSTGAYTSSYCAVSFNGFPPLPTFFVRKKPKK